MLRAYICRYIYNIDKHLFNMNHHTLTVKSQMTYYSFNINETSSRILFFEIVNQLVESKKTHTHIGCSRGTYTNRTQNVHKPYSKYIQLQV